MIVYLNGQFLPVEEAKISPLDRGFLFADAVYEVIPVYHGKLFHAQAHLERMNASLKHMYFTHQLDVPDWIKRLEQLVEKNGGGNLKIYLQVSRGAEDDRKHRIPDGIEPTIYAHAAPLSSPAIDTLGKGIKAITLPDPRWQYCHIKTTALMANILAYQEAKLKGFDEAILCRDGMVLEATSANVFLVINDTLITPPTDGLILGGITRETIIDIAKEKAIPCDVRPVAEIELLNAQEIWKCSSTNEISPIIELNGKAVGNGKAGPVWKNMIQWYREYIERV